jgi:hypothetical protein
MGLMLIIGDLTICCTSEVKQSNKSLLGHAYRKDCDLKTSERVIIF